MLPARCWRVGFHDGLLLGRAVNSECGRRFLPVRNPFRRENQKSIGLRLANGFAATETESLVSYLQINDHG